jgi:hypothetical protein
MRISTLLRYLLGDRQAILAVAANRATLWLGLLFVLSAALARDYDGEDLLHEPRHLLIPFGASLAASLVLFIVAYGMAICKDAPARQFFPAYRSFLGLFWLTAPLAWLYAIPYERFLNPMQAVQANLFTLALVAVWRVALMVRILNVTMGYPLLAALCLVMTFANAVSLSLLSFLPFPITDFMAGLRLSEADSIRRSVAVLVLEGGFCTLPIWVAGALSLGFVGQRYWRVAKLDPAKGTRPSWAMWLLACSSVAGWLLVLPFTQPEQQLRRRVELLFADGRTADALAEMSAHNVTDFPPHWEPPPRFPTSRVLDTWDEIEKGPVPPWIRQVYLRKLQDLLSSRYNIYPDLERIGRLLSRLPEGPGIIEELKRGHYDYLLEQLKPYMSQSERSQG